MSLKAVKPVSLGVSLGFLLALGACSTPRERCISDAVGEYRTLLRVVEETRQNVARGYAIHSDRVPYTVYKTCFTKDPKTGAAIPYSCPQTRYRTQTTPVPIDVTEERRKLRDYERTLPEYRARTESQVRWCEARYPPEA